MRNVSFNPIETIEGRGEEEGDGGNLALARVLLSSNESVKRMGMKARRVGMRREIREIVIEERRGRNRRSDDGGA